MLKWLERRRRSRKLRSTAAIVPALLARSYGASVTYSPAQVTTTCKKLALAPDLTLAALAGCCTRADFAALGGDHTPALYDGLRAEMADLFGMDADTLSAEALRKRKIKPAWNPISSWTSDWSLYRDHGTSNFD